MCRGCDLDTSLWIDGCRVFFATTWMRRMRTADFQNHICKLFLRQSHNVPIHRNFHMSPWNICPTNRQRYRTEKVKEKFNSRRNIPNVSFVDHFWKENCGCGVKDSVSVLSLPLEFGDLCHGPCTTVGPWQFSHLFT